MWSQIECLTFWVMNLTLFFLHPYVIYATYIGNQLSYPSLMIYISQAIPIDFRHLSFGSLITSYLFGSRIFFSFNCSGWSTLHGVSFNWSRLINPLWNLLYLSGWSILHGISCSWAGWSICFLCFRCLSRMTSPLKYTTEVVIIHVLFLLYFPSFTFALNLNLT